jgi:hypothetical protein
MLPWKCLRTSWPCLVLLSGLLGCAPPQTATPVAVLAGEPGSTATLLPAGDDHLVTARAAPGSVAPIPVFCSEPSPDFARAFGHAYGATASVTEGATGSAGLSASDSEAVTAMLGRSAGVVALRDGLYSACEAYANGIIGRDAYGLIISQYGTLLAQLAGAGTTDPAVLQQQAVQALLVACITDADPSVPPGVAQGRLNPLLEASCPSLITEIVAGVPGLLKPAPVPKAAPTAPAPAPGPAAPAPGAPAKPKPAA